MPFGYCTLLIAVRLFLWQSRLQLEVTEGADIVAPYIERDAGVVLGHGSFQSCVALLVKDSRKAGLFRCASAAWATAQSRDGENLIVAFRSYGIVCNNLMPMPNVSQPGKNAAPHHPAVPQFGGLYRNIWRHAAGAR